MHLKKAPASGPATQAERSAAIRPKQSYRASPSGRRQVQKRSRRARSTKSLQAQGSEYGPAFQGLGRAWSLDDAIYAEIGLDEDELPTAAKYTVHPALLDASLHTMFFAAEVEEGIALPFAFTDVRVPIGGAGALRVRSVKSPAGAAAENGLAEDAPARMNIEAFSESGEHLVSIGGVVAPCRRPRAVQIRSRQATTRCLSLSGCWLKKLPLMLQRMRPRRQLAVIGQLSLELPGARSVDRIAELDSSEADSCRARLVTSENR